MYASNYGRKSFGIIRKINGKPMKIIHLADETWDSGLTDYALILASAQKKAGHTIYLACLANSFAEKKGFFKFLHFAKKISDIKPDILNTHTGSTHTLAVVAKKLSTHKLLLVRTRADARPITKKIFSDFLWKNTDGFVAANSKILRRFNEKITPKIPSRFILQAIENPPTPETKKTPNTIGILARLDPIKGHKTAIEAISILKEQLPQVILKISGTEQNTTWDELKNYARKLNVSEHIKFEGYVEDKYKFINECTLGLIPSVASEAVCRAAIEWISQGSPVVASDVGGISDTINEYIGILVEPANPKALANALEEILLDTDKQKKMSDAALKHFKQNFTTEVFEKNTLRFYEFLICEKLKKEIEKIP
jgi:glycosyltransferase involved in cell wall biosynthesis